MVRVKLRNVTYETENLGRLRTGLTECTVLLNKDGKFPLTAPCKIAAYGSGVRHTLKGGTGSGKVNSRFFVTVEQGLRRISMMETPIDGGFKKIIKRYVYVKTRSLS